MLKNKISLCALLGTNVTVFGFFLMCVVLVLNEEAGNHIDNEEMLGMAATTVFGGAFMLSGIGLSFRQKWARIVINVFSIVVLVILMMTTYFLFWEDGVPRQWKNRIPVVSMFVFMYVAISGLFLILNNEKISEELMNP